MSETRVDCFYYQFTGGVDHVPAWRHFQTVTERLQAGSFRLDGEWYRRLIQNKSGETIPALAIWNPETDITTVIVGREFEDHEMLTEQVTSPVLPEQLRTEEWRP